MRWANHVCGLCCPTIVGTDHGDCAGAPGSRDLENRGAFSFHPLRLGRKDKNKILKRGKKCS
jgi:hypothetical protein